MLSVNIATSTDVTIVEKNLTLEAEWWGLKFSVLHLSRERLCYFIGWLK